MNVDARVAHPSEAAANRAARRAMCGFALSLAVGCQPDPVATDLDNWYYGIGAVMVENTALAVKFQDFAAEIKSTKKKGKLSPKAVASHLKDNLLPLAVTISEHADSVRPSLPEHQELHDSLATIWTDRRDTYANIIEAWNNDNPGDLTAAMVHCQELRISEGMWFESANAVLEPKGYHFDEYAVKPPKRPDPK